MFGYIMANTGESGRLTEEEKARYNACYCGLCRSLHRAHGFLGRMTLTYDMTFLVMLLSSLYEMVDPEETAGEERCPAHPLRRRSYWQTRYTHYAADLNLLLARYNCLDDWEDEHRPDRWLLAAMLKRRCDRIAAQYPRQSEAIRRELAALHRYEAGPEVSADEAANCFGRLMGELFVVNESDHWSPTLRTLGESMGRFIYIMDACIDYAGDERHNQPNPLRALDSGPRSALGDYELLCLLLSDASKAFEYLPLEQDVGILRNIIYSGVWGKFALKFKDELQELADRVPIEQESPARQLCRSCTGRGACRKQRISEND